MTVSIVQITFMQLKHTICTVTWVWDKSYIRIWGTWSDANCI